MIGTKIVYGVEYNVAAVKAMTKTEFVKTYKNWLGKHVDDVYYQVTGKKPPKGKDKD